MRRLMMRPSRPWCREWTVNEPKSCVCNYEWHAGVQERVVVVANGVLHQRPSLFTCIVGCTVKFEVRSHVFFDFGYR